MKVRVEVVEGLPEDEVLIRCGRPNEEVRKIRQFVLEQSQPNPLTFYKRKQEFHFPLDRVLFFETEGESVYAHTASDSYRIRYRLYELEKILPENFERASKSAILNLKHVYSITRSLSSSRLVRFAGTHKEIYVSRHYYRGLRLRLNERSGYEA